MISSPCTFPYFLQKSGCDRLSGLGWIRSSWCKENVHLQRISLRSGCWWWTSHTTQNQSDTGWERTVDTQKFTFCLRPHMQYLWGSEDNTFCMSPKLDGKEAQDVHRATVENGESSYLTQGQMSQSFCTCSTCYIFAITTLKHGVILYCLCKATEITICLFYRLLQAGSICLNHAHKHSWEGKTNCGVMIWTGVP